MRINRREQSRFSIGGWNRYGLVFQSHNQLDRQVICLPSLAKKRRCRRAAVAVEFAVVAPLFLAIILGVTRVSHMYETQNLLASAAREGARFGAMDRNGMLGEGNSSNDKLAADVQHFLTAQGLPSDNVNIEIKHAGTDNDFDLDDPGNNLKLFEVRVEVPYSDVSGYEIVPADDYMLRSVVTFRNARMIVSD